MSGKEAWGAFVGAYRKQHKCSLKAAMQGASPMYQAYRSAASHEPETQRKRKETIAKKAEAAAKKKIEAFAQKAEKAKAELERKKKKQKEMADNRPPDYWEKRKVEQEKEEKAAWERLRRQKQEWEDAEKLMEFREQQRVLAIRKKIRDSPSTLNTCEEFKEFCKVNKHYSRVTDVQGHASGNKACFKALALKVHPDKGGTGKGMKELQECNLWLSAPH